MKLFFQSGISSSHLKKIKVIMKESLFYRSVRAFFTGLFGTIGFMIALFLFFMGIALLYSLSEKEEYGSDIKLRPDAEGHRKKIAMDSPVLLEIPIEGVIGGDSLSAEKIEEILLKSREKTLKPARVKGILLTVNSPGGGVISSDQIYHLLTQYKEHYEVPIFAYIDGLCASGGYYISCAADKIYASDVSLIGSVGVITPPFFNVSETIKKIGAEARVLYAGKGKDAMNPFRPWKEGEEENYKQLIDYYYTMFVQIVTSKRPDIDKQKLIEVYGAKVFPPFQAQEDGYIDVIDASRSMVLQDLARAAKIPEGEKYQVITFKSQTTWNKIFQSRSPLLTGELKHTLNIAGEESSSNGLPFSFLGF